MVKPPPGSPRTIREQLRRVADTARSLENKGHYRFYTYTEGDIAESLAAPSTMPDGSEWDPARGWAEDTIATVCSQFIWYAMKQNDLEIEGLIEESDIGADADELTPDGLYFYTEQERVAAGKVLWSVIWNKVYNKIDSRFLAFVSDAPDDYAGQVRIRNIAVLLTSLCQANPVLILILLPFIACKLFCIRQVLSGNEGYPTGCRIV